MTKKAKAELPRLAAGPAKRALAFDASTRVTAEQAEQLHAAGYRTAIRYVDRVPADPAKADKQWPINLTTAEMADLLLAGLDVSLVQYHSTAYASTERGAKVGKALGKATGAVAASNAKALGAPQGVTIWCDAEDWYRVPSLTHAREHLVAWAAEVKARGYDPGLYVGGGLGNPEIGYLDGQTLFGLPHYRSYWRSAIAVPQLVRRGWTMVQGLQTQAFGLELDPNVACLDHYYGTAREHRFKVITRA